jgi:DNA polymerase-3 subunit epsilon
MEESNKEPQMNKIRTEEEKIQDRDRAILDCREILSDHYIVLDTETTGLESFAEPCEVGILYDDGTRYNILVKPSVPIGVEATYIHHITNEDVADAPPISVILDKIPNGYSMVIYNSKYDLMVLRNALRVEGIVSKESRIKKVYDAIKIYAAYYGDWNEYFSSYKFQRLEKACGQCGINIDVTLHDALNDCIMTDKLIKYMAEQKLSTE